MELFTDSSIQANDKYRKYETASPVATKAAEKINELTGSKDYAAQVAEEKLAEGNFISSENPQVSSFDDMNEVEKIQYRGLADSASKINDTQGHLTDMAKAEESGLDSGIYNMDENISKPSNAIYDDESNGRYWDYINSNGGIKEPEPIVHKFGYTAESNPLPYLDVSAQMDLYEPEQVDKLGMIKEQSIDDGTFTMENMTSNWMDGKQYKRYQDELGMGGREDIDDDLLYSKLDEAANYGFKIFVPDDASYAKMVRESAETAAARAANELADSRESLTDYRIFYNDRDGNKVGISGKEYDDSVNDYFNTISKGLADDLVEPALEPGKTLGDINRENSPMLNKDLDHEGMQGYTHDRVVKLDDGRIKKGSFELHKLPTFDRDENGEPFVVDPTIQVIFDDGEIIEFADEEDMVNSISSDGLVPVSDDKADMWIPDMVMNNGTSVPYDKVLDIAQDNRGKGISYDFGPLGIGKPKRMIKEWAEGGIEDFIPKMIDIATGSAPFFFLPISIPTGLSRAMAATHSIDPSTIKADGTARKLADNISNEQYMASILGSALQPLTEVGLGRIGTKVFNPSKWLTKKMGERAAMPAIDWAAGTFGEGIEEIPGNLVEEYMQNGLTNYYANDIVDEEGNTIYDSTGHALKDSDTSLQDRFMNFASGVPEAFWSGSALGGLFGLKDLPGTVKDTKGIIDANRKLREAGLKPFVEAYDKNAEFELDPEYEERLRRSNG